MTYQKAITDASTGETVLIELTAAEVAELEAKQAANALAQAAESAAVAAEADVLAGLPTADDINAATKIADLKDFMLKQNAVIALLLKRIGE